MQANDSSHSWIDALADQAESVHGEMGAESPRLAVDGFAADEYLDARAPADPFPAQRRPHERLRDLLTPASAAPGLRAAH